MDTVQKGWDEMTEESGKRGEDTPAKKTSGALPPKSRRDVLRERLRKAATNAGPPSDDWSTADLPDDVTRK